MKQVVFIFSFVLFFSACQEVNDAEKPDDFIEKEKMIDILFDLSKLEASKNYSQREFNNREVDIKELVYQKHQVDSAQVAENMAFYAEDFKLNDEVFDSVKERLIREKKFFDSIVSIENKKDLTKKQSDSLVNKLKENLLQAQEAAN